MIGKYVTEFIGTFFLVLTIALAVHTSGDHFAMVGPLAIGGVLTVLVYMGGHISGAHYNPAVTLALFLRGKCSFVDIVPYILCQLGGAIAATYVGWWMSGAESMLLPAPGGETPDLFKAVINEGLFTFVLVLVILNVATSPKTEGNSFYGIAIGFTVLAAAYVGGGISGGAYNPAVGLGPIIANMINGLETFPPYFWIYLVGPLAGAAAAVLAYQLQHLDAHHDDE